MIPRGLATKSTKIVAGCGRGCCAPIGAAAVTAWSGAWGVALGGAGGAASDGGEVAPVAGVDLEGGAEAGDDAAALGLEADELKVGQRGDDVDGGAEFLAEGEDEGGVGGGLAGDGLGGAGEGEAAAGEGIAGRVFRFEEENAGARVDAEVAGVRGESADVDDERAVGLEEGGGNGGVGRAVGRGGAENDGGELGAEGGGELAGAGEGIGHGGRQARMGLMTWPSTSVRR